MVKKKFKHTEKTKQMIRDSNKRRYNAGEKFGFQKGHPVYTTKGQFKKGHKPVSPFKKGNHPKTEFKKGCQSPWKGKKRSPLSEEWKKNIGKVNKGEKSHFWIDGRTSENQKIRHSIEFRLWRGAVFARDNWTCQKCQARSGKKLVFLHPHHVYNFAQYPDLRFAIDNGITFCKKCHDLFHRIYGRRNNTKEQLEEFLKYE